MVKATAIRRWFKLYECHLVDIIYGVARSFVAISRVSTVVD